VGRADVSGTFWYQTKSGDSLWSISRQIYGSLHLDWLIEGNPGGPNHRITPVRLSWLNGLGFLPAGECLWIPWVNRTNTCSNHPLGPYYSYDTSSTPSAGSLYWRYRAASKYIYDQMMTNRRYGAGFPAPVFHFEASWWCAFLLSCTIENGETLAAFAYHEHPRVSWLPGGDWDHKPDLPRLVGSAGGFSTAVVGDPAPEVLYYDAWSNIHYGYVGRAHGFPAWLLLSANALPVAGTFDRADVASVQLGIRLWNSYGSALTLGQLRNAVKEEMNVWRNLEPDEVRPGLHP
jgi:hypothetical protein